MYWTELRRPGSDQNVLERLRSCVIADSCSCDNIIPNAACNTFKLYDSYERAVTGLNLKVSDLILFWQPQNPTNLSNPNKSDVLFKESCISS